MDTAAAAEPPVDAAAGIVVPSATCLGCGCTCDDIALLVTDNRIVEARNTCALGAQWFGDGTVPARAFASGREATAEAALDAAAALLAGAARPLVYLAPEISSEAQREAIAIADMLRARIDSVTSATALPSILAAQERGRAAATLGELRNRADVLVFWGVDPAQRYPRFWSRYAPEPAGLQVPGGRRGRKIIAVDVGGARGPEDADVRVTVPAAVEVATLIALTAAVASSSTSQRPGDAASPSPVNPATEPPGGQTIDAAAIAQNLLPALIGGRYVALIADAEPGEAGAEADTAGTGAHVGGAVDLSRASALIALSQALNGPTRCALTTLRGGGNRSGADAALTAHTGYPAGVDFSRGYPRYRPYDRSGLTGTVDAVLVLGSLAHVPVDVQRRLGQVATVVIGPRASEKPPARAQVVIDVGVPGIHCGGTALRMDDVPLPLRQSIDGPPDAAVLIRELRNRLFLLPLAAARP